MQVLKCILIHHKLPKSSYQSLRFLSMLTSSFACLHRDLDDPRPYPSYPGLALPEKKGDCWLSKVQILGGLVEKSEVATSFVRCSCSGLLTSYVSGSCLGVCRSSGFCSCCGHVVVFWLGPDMLSC
jgi:hypothetical protein